MRAGAESFSRTNRGGADCGMQFRGAGAAWARICYAKPIMLVRLEVRNLAVVEAAEALFGPGLNVITGETGAGKSVLMGALHLILGERADRAAIRTGADEAAVCAVYELADPRAVDAALREAGLPACEEGTLILRRVVAANGSGRIRVNDAPATAALLRRLAPFLTDIHGPNDNLSLLDEGFQLRLLTAYAGAGREAADYAARWEALQALRARLREAEGDPGARAAELERLAYELEEIRQVNPTEEDGEPLTERHRAAANAGEILTLGSALTEGLTDGEGAIAERLMELHRALRALEGLLPEAAGWGEELTSAQVQLQELSRTIAVRLSQVEADPEEMERLEARLGQIQRLRRKYGPTLEDVLAHWRAVGERLRTLNDREGDIEGLRRQAAEAEAALRRAGEALRARRAEAAPRLSAAITAELRDLGFAQASFPIALEAVEPGPSGMDRAIFRFEPNPGEAARPLAAIASSGEIARVMLAVKVILARHDATPTLVFDEIDANVGGETGRKVGEKLRRLAEGGTQVLCITHQPQAAVWGQTHFRVSKAVEAGRTVTRVERLAPEARVGEVARMLGGGDAALRHAEAMLAAQNPTQTELGL